MNLQLPLVVLLLSIAPTLFGGQSELSNWYVGKEGKATSWAGSYEQAAGNPQKWDYVTDWQLNRAKFFTGIKQDVYAIAILKADEDYRQGLSIPSGSAFVTFVSRAGSSG